MKKTLLKIGFVMFCVGAAIFLLLPFLETTVPASTALQSGQAQVVSENPLNVISKRLATLFGHKERSQKTLPGQDNTTNSLLIAQNYPPYDSSNKQAAGQTTPPSTPSSQTVEVPPSTQPYDYENASFQADNGEWVLVQQTAPAHSAPGMHEVNVHDNPYDRYVRQERAKNFGPQAPKQEIPDSKWARLVQPLKTFFGLDAPHAVSSNSSRIRREDEKGRSLGTADNALGTGNNNSSYERMRMYMPEISPQQWALMTPEERESYKQHKAARDFAELLSGDKAARDAAEMVANIKIPFAETEEKKQEKESLIERLTEENKEGIREKVLAIIQENASKTAIDEFGLSSNGCSSRPSNIATCSSEGTQQPLTLDQIVTAQEANAKAFLEKTKFILPEGLSFITILGDTKQTLSDIEKMKQYPGREVQGDIEEFLYKQQKCGESPCYWVPNSNPSDTEMPDILKTVGGSQLVPDPYNTYDEFKDKWIQAKRKELEANNAPVDLKELENQWNAYRPNWIPYSETLLVQLNNDNMQILTDRSGNTTDRKPPVFPIVTDPAVAPQVAELIGPLSFVYSNPKALSEADDPTQAGEILTEGLGNNVNATKDAIEEITQKAIQEGVTASLNNTISNSNQQGGGIFNLLDAVKDWRKGNSPTK